jgi:hypothetical protein
MPPARRPVAVRLPGPPAMPTQSAAIAVGGLKPLRRPGCGDLVAADYGTRTGPAQRLRTGGLRSAAR